MTESCKLTVKVYERRISLLFFHYKSEVFSHPRNLLEAIDEAGIWQQGTVLTLTERLFNFLLSAILRRQQNHNVVSSRKDYFPN